VRGFKNFLMQGDLVVVAVGLVIALAFSTLVKAFTDDVITPLVNAAGGHGSTGIGVRVNGHLLQLGAFVSAVIYFVVFMAVVYFLIVVPYRAYSARRGRRVFAEPPAVKSCPECLSGDLPVAATRCSHCGIALPSSA